jgi:all-beta uncharacterized protein
LPASTRTRRYWLRLTLTLLVAAVAASASAQQVTDPTRGEFNPSPDHNTISGGTAVVQSYRLEFFVMGAAQPTQTTSLGKPTPDPDGVIRVNLVSAFSGWPVPGTLYEAAVVAVGPGGEGRSSRSNPFLFSPPCTATVAPLTQPMGPPGGNGSSSVTTPGGCGWTAGSNAPWITITSGSSGTGNGVVNYSVAANASTTSRSGSLTVAGSTVTVNQSGCTYTVTPASQNVPAAAGSGSATTATQSVCAWTAVSNAGWITITSGSGGTGNGTTNYTIAANTAGTPRTGTLTIAGSTVSVTQSGVPCTYGVTPVTQNLPSTAGGGTETITAPTGCAWTASDNAAWISLTPNKGSGNGTVTFTVTANTAFTERTGLMTIAGQNVSVTQAPTCNFTVTPTTLSVAYAGGPQTTSITANCAWTAVSNVPWITVTSGGSGSTNGSTGFTVAANTGVDRSGTLTIAGQTVSVTQQTAPPSAPGGARLIP